MPRHLSVVFLLGVALLTLPAPAAAQTDPHASTLPLPQDAAINVKTQYGAKGDGTTDDTQALLNALNDGRSGDQVPEYYFGRPRAVFLPAGTYLVSDTIFWEGCCLTLVGEGYGQSIIRLKNNTSGFNNPNEPKPVLLTSPSGNAAFRQHIWNIGVHTGSGNAGAVGIDYLSSNVGSLRGVAITSGDGQGVTGLSLLRPWPGPQIMRDLRIDGFDYGVMVDQSIAGPVFENITLTNQNVAGFRNRRNATAIRGLFSNNSVPALQSVDNQGSVVLIDSVLEGGAGSATAIENDKADLFLRNVTTSGYQNALVDDKSNDPTVTLPGGTINEYTTGDVQTLWDDVQTRSLNLPIKETPFFHDMTLSNWAKYVPDSQFLNRENNRLFVQNLLDSGATTIYFPPGASPFDGTVTVPASVRRIVAYGHVVNNYDGIGLRFRVNEASNTPLIVEGFGYGITVEHAANRPIVVRHGGIYREFPGAGGDIFLEDVVMGVPAVTFSSNIDGVWARQLNLENLNTNNDQNPLLINNGTDVWILGTKTEGRATVIETNPGGRTELMGTVLYPVREFTSQDRAAFIVNDAQMSFTTAWSGFRQDFVYPLWVTETRNGETRSIPVVYNPSDPPNFSRTMPLFVAGGTLEAYDMDDNQLITPADAAFVINRLGQSGLTGNDARADIDGDGTVTMTEANTIISYIGETIP